MVRLSELPQEEQTQLLAVDCPRFDKQPFVAGPLLKARRVAIISSAGLLKRGDKRFRSGDAGYRILPADVLTGDVLMSHISVDFDRTGFQQDWNVVLPLDRLHELAAAGDIGSVAGMHYSFMGATEPQAMERNTREVAGRLKQDRVDAALLVPV